MAQQGKSFRHGQSMAPYREPLKAHKMAKPSLFNKIKNLLDRKTGLSSKASEKSIQTKFSSSRRNAADSHMAAIPGGFFTPSNTSTSINLPKHRNLRRKDSSNISVVDGHPSIEDETADESCSADISNAKLADFFRGKGDQPLSDMEMEGVISLMRKANTAESSRRSSVANSVDHTNDFIDVGVSRVLKSSRAPSLTSSSFRAPTFIPKYDTSSGSHSIANPSIRSSSSRRRVFDYSNLPSPYRTTVYKYSAADNRDNARAQSSNSVSPIASSKSSVQEVPPSPVNGDHKKISNTASALVSLLDGSSSNKQQPVSQLANPYASHVRKYKKVLEGQNIRQNSFVAPQDPQEHNNSQGFKTDNTGPEILPKTQSTFEKYKPLRSSSLRSGIEIHEQPSHSLQNNLETSKKLPTSNFTFKFNNSTDDRESNKKKEVKEENASSVLFASQKEPLIPAHQIPEDNPPQKLNTKRALNKVNDVAYPSTDKKPPTIENVSKNRFSSSLEKSKATSQFSVQSPNVLRIAETFDFGTPIPSNLNTDVLDDNKVKELRSSFIF